MCDCSRTDAHGFYPRQQLPGGWQNVHVVFQRSNGVTRSWRYEILNSSTLDRYRHEPLIIIATKCFGLFLIVQPVYFLMYSMLHFIRLFLVPIVNLSPLAFFKEAWKIVQIPFLYIGMEFAALYGIVCPLEGRALLGKLELALHNGISDLLLYTESGKALWIDLFGEEALQKRITRRQAVQYERTARSFIEYVKEAFFEEDPQHALFMGFCMQPLGNRNDPHLISVEPLLDPLTV